MALLAAIHISGSYGPPNEAQNQDVIKLSQIMMTVLLESIAIFNTCQIIFVSNNRSKVQFQPWYNYRASFIHMCLITFLHSEFDGQKHTSAMYDSLEVLSS